MIDKDYCIDIPDERDYLYDFLWESKELPSKVMLLAKEIQDQKKDGWTYWCVYYGWSSWANITNEYAWNSIEDITWNDLCKKAVDLLYLDPDKWSSLQNWRKLLKDDKYIEWYYKVVWLEVMKQSLSNRQIIYTWSNQIARKKMLDDNIVVKWESYWHCFIIVGYDDDKWYFICQNSYWNEKYDKWYFYLKYEDISLLFTCYAFEVKQEKILSYKEKIMSNIKNEAAKTAFENGFWNWLNWDKPASREEVAIMCQRVFEKLKK